MIKRGVVILALALSAAVPAAAGPTGAEPARGVFCAALDAALKAAEESPPFQSAHLNLANAPDSSRLTVPGFSSHDCRVSYDSDGEGRKRSLWCSRNLAPPELTAANLVADTSRCLGREPSLDRGPTGAGRGFRYDLGRVEILIDQQCDDRCHVGRIVSYRIRSRVNRPPAK